MSVEVEPSELAFRRPFTVEVARTLSIRNTSSTPVAFKVKTTAPKQYCVRPNAGRVEPGQSFDVTVLLQAMKTEPPMDTKCRDKFLVQSAPITTDKEFASVASVLESTQKNLVREQKIRVNWEADSDEAAQESPAPVAATPVKPALANGALDTPDVSRSFSSPSTHLDTPASDPSLAEPEEEKSVLEAPKAVAVQAATTVANAAQVTYEELKQKLAQAEAQLANVTDAGLRKRNTKTTAESSDSPAPNLATAMKPAASGVPVHVVTLLCFVSFLLAYFFF
jgi:hypothetical protein